MSDWKLIQIQYLWFTEKAICLETGEKELGRQNSVQYKLDWTNHLFKYKMAMTHAASEHMYYLCSEKGYRTTWTALHILVVMTVQNTWEGVWHLTAWVDAVKTEEGDTFTDRDMLRLKVCGLNLRFISSAHNMCQVMHASVNACVSTCASVFVGVHITAAALKRNVLISRHY